MRFAPFYMNNSSTTTPKTTSAMSNLPNHFEEDPTIVYVPNNTTKKRKNEEAEAAQPLLLKKKITPAIAAAAAFSSYQSNANSQKPPASTATNTNTKTKSSKKKKAAAKTQGTPSCSSYSSSTEEEEDEGDKILEGPTTGKFSPRHYQQDDHSSRDLEKGNESSEEKTTNKATTFLQKFCECMNQEIDTPTCVMLIISLLLLIAADIYLLYRYRSLCKNTDIMILDLHQTPFGTGQPITYPMILLDEGQVLPPDLNDLPKQGQVQVLQRMPPAPSAFETMKEDLDQWIKSWTKNNEQVQDKQIII